ncbi:efflux transporter outer membrane subunit [Stenotrophomonas mori]|uniref:Efflux transporter outer membrane subunit n=1 Tax=Stenotrophomonas mori TaxID=2871096 RepID=A0ABT0SI32_9GAMM|nr:efflux transporter outer membrane subunit [Stenotrophomonas mori]MCL7714986.1 efflux transporter outer membrane subunit [Stenotrophomonas mori]
MNDIARIATLAVALMAAGCAVGPDFQRPEAPRTDAWIQGRLPGTTVSAPGPVGDAQRFLHDRPVPARWWTAFGSTELDALVAAALQANPDLQAAEAALREARENAAAQRGGFWPEADLQLQPLRERAAEEDSSALSLHTAQLTISYAPDVFGGRRREAEALGAELDAQRFEREAVYLTLVANVVESAIGGAALRAQLAASEARVAQSQRLLEIVQRQHRAGDAGGSEVAAQEAELAQARAELPPLHKELAARRHQLAALTGQLPGAAALPELRLDSLSLPVELPLGVPSQLVRQRPDVRAAEARLQAASAAIGVAAAARLPSITLSAGAGRYGTRASPFGQTGSGFWSIGAELLQPLFRGGALRHGQRAAVAAYEQAQAQYRATVLGAFQDTADALQAIVSDAQALQAAHAADAAAHRSLAMAIRQRALGATSQADLLLAQQAREDTAIALVQARAERLASTVALYQALGGGWQAAADATAARE